MEQRIVSIRPFIGAKDYQLSAAFYRDCGFTQKELSKNMSLFTLEHIAFYLQDAYVKDWVDNTMVFLEVDRLDQFYKSFVHINLPGKYNGVKLTPIKNFDWGRECYLHDPSGILWHFGEFRK
ncbi:glyoxalase [Pollutibacter soli]|uniref:glyoxalase n=1 Tax=Pollutibacter soli TaxID=3034157 RepID=UPI003014185F